MISSKFLTVEKEREYLEMKNAAEILVFMSMQGSNTARNQPSWDSGPSTSRSNKKRLRLSTNSNNLPPPPPPPPSLQLANAGQPIHIITRQLQWSDISKQQQRLSMPCNQVQNDEIFLTVDELTVLRRGDYIPIKVQDPTGRRYSSHIRRNASGKNTYSYAIGKPWNDIKRENQFTEGMKINISAIREANNELIILLKRV